MDVGLWSSSEQCSRLCGSDGVRLSRIALIMETHRDIHLTALMDQFDLLERRLEREINTDAALVEIRETGNAIDDALRQLSAYQPQSAQGERLKFRFLLSKLVNRYPDLQGSDIVNALFAMAETDATIESKVWSQVH